MLREAESPKGNRAIPISKVRSEVREQSQRTEVTVLWRTWERIQKTGVWTWLSFTSQKSFCIDDFIQTSLCQGRHY